MAGKPYKPIGSVRYPVQWPGNGPAAMVFPPTPIANDEYTDNNGTTWVFNANGAWLPKVQTHVIQPYSYGPVIEDAYLVAALNGTPGYAAWDSGASYAAVTFGTTLTEAVRCVAGDPLGNRFIVGKDTAPHYSIRDMTGANVGPDFNANGVTDDGDRVAWSQDGAKLAFGYLRSSVQRKRVHRVSDGVALGTEFNLGSSGAITFFLDDDLVFFSGTGTSQTYEYTLADSLGQGYTLDQLTNNMFAQLNTQTANHCAATNNIARTSISSPYLQVYLNPTDPTAAATAADLSGLSPAIDSLFGMRDAVFSLDGSELFVCWNAAKSILGSSVTLAAIDTATWTWGRAAVGVTNAHTARCMALSADGQKLAAVHGGTNVTVYDTSDFSVLATMTAPATAVEISWTPKV